MRHRRFAGTRVASTLQSCGIIGPKTVKSVSKWNWSPFCEQFAEIVHDPTLSLPTGARLPPSAEVFAQLPIDDKLLQEPPRDKQVFEQCGIEKVMNGMGYVLSHNTALDKLELMAKILDDNQIMVKKLARARREEMSARRYEKKIDLCAHDFLTLCGFDSGPFEITAEGGDFKIFGKTCHSDGDYYVIVTPNNDLVLVFEDKSLKEGEVLRKQGHLGQIVGELLQMLSLNRDKKKFHSVFAVRFINYRVTAFRVEPERATLTTLCDTCKTPKKKLQLLCSVATPTTSLGLSLIDSKERAQALQIMADMRQFVLNSITK